MEIGQNIGLTGRVYTEIKRKDGSVERKDWGNNIIVNNGLAAWAGLAGGVDGIAPFQYLALGTGATAEDASQTQLTNEVSASGLSRKKATISRTTDTITNDTLRLETTWTATANVTVREVGVFNAGSSGLMCARKVINSTLQDTEDIRVVYELQISRS